MKDSEKDLIVGWGIAGAVLAWQLYFRQRNFKVIDSGQNHSSKIAAGLVNPIVFKRLTKSWKADVLMPFAQEFYTQIESVTGEQLISNENILKVLRDVEEENDWTLKVNDPAFEKYMGFEQDRTVAGIIAPNGFGQVKTFGNLDTQRFMDVSKSFFEGEGVEFANQAYKMEGDSVSGYQYFCEGVGIQENPIFNYLPLKPTHGEVLIVKIKDYHCAETINKNLFILPVGDQLYKVGATYNWELNQPIPTLAGKEELIDRLKAFTDFDFEVVDHLAGVRPTVHDRRPLLGKHPVHTKAVVFNGLGTKGVLLAPYFANQLVAHVLDGQELDQEVAITRFESRRE